MSQVRRIAARKVILPRDLERMQRLLVIARRCCNGPHMLGQEVSAHDERKIPKLKELEVALRDVCLGERRKAVVFSEWTDMTERVEALCDRLKLPAYHLRGNVAVKRRPGLIRSFSDAAGPAVFISTDAGGVGLNLQAADVVINLDLPWNPARLEQRIARVHRIGSKGTVQELLLVNRDSIEERILYLHDTKRNVLENIWAKQGADTIAAPGGSGAFRAMVQALMEPPASAAAVGQPSETTVRPAEAAAPSASSKAPGNVESSPPVDPEALTAAVAAVAPTLPPDHRKSLAAVFRALADALE